MVDHITQTLALPGEGLWEHLSNDYLKALKSLLEHPPHVEHLVREWTHLVNFCLRGMRPSENEGSQLTIRSNTRLRSESAGANDERSTPVRATPSLSHGRPSVDTSSSTGIVDLLLVCLKLLTASPNAPIHNQAESVLSTVADYLTSSSISASTSQLSAFGTFNAVLARTATDDIELTQSAITNIIPTIRRLWITKSVHLRDEMLVTLMLAKTSLARFGQRPPSDFVVETLESLLEVIHDDYLKCIERGKEGDSLQTDDLVFSPDGGVKPMGIPSIAPRLGYSRAEENWTTVSIIASLSLLLDRISISSSTLADDSVPNKRPRLLSRSEDALRDASSSSGASRICALQLIPFLLNEHEFSPDSLASSLGHLIPFILDDNHVMASWTMIAIARSVCICC